MKWKNIFFKKCSTGCQKLKKIKLCFSILYGGGPTEEWKIQYFFSTLMASLRDISGRRHENKSCQLWLLEPPRTPKEPSQSSTTPSQSHKDTPNLEPLKDISWRRHENKSCWLWQIEPPRSFRNHPRNLLSFTTPSQSHKDTHSLESLKDISWRRHANKSC